MTDSGRTTSKSGFDKRLVLLILAPLMAVPIIVVGIIMVGVLSQAEGGAALGIFLLFPVMAIGILFIVGFTLAVALSSIGKSSDPRAVLVRTVMSRPGATAEELRNAVAEATGEEIGPTGDIADDEETLRLLAEIEAEAKPAWVPDTEPIERTLRLAWTAVGVTLVLMVGGYMMGRAWWEVLALGVFAITVTLIWAAAEGGFRKSG